jgi:Putative Tad-like Flp pilus-assembly
LAGARDIGSTTNDPVQSATSYSGVSGNKNVPSNFAATMASGYPVLKCFTSTGVTCVSGKSGVPSANGIQVKQQATVPTFFGNVLGISSLSISASATAGAKGGKASPVDVMIIIDTTAPMNNYDASCGATQIAWPQITPCAALLAIATDSTKFYADTSAVCPVGANPPSGLSCLFQNFGTSLTGARMLPDNTN